MIRKVFLLITFLFINCISSLVFANIQQKIIEAEKDYISNRFLNAAFMFADDYKSLLTAARVFLL